MSKVKDNYENSFSGRFDRWLNGETDLLDGNMEIVLPEENPDGTIKPSKKELHLTEEQLKTIHEKEHQTVYSEKTNRRLKAYQWGYRIASVALCLAIIGLMLWMTLYLPEFGMADNPVNNEVSARYIESGLEETGAVNFVTGMILDYRAFDTFGESCVLFIACICVQILLRLDDKNPRKEVVEEMEKAKNDRFYEPKNDLILQKVAVVLVPLLFVFGIYIILNGHLSPGGGFSGGAVLGASLILYLNAYGFEKTERFFTNKTFRVVTLVALSFYCLAKSYSFFTGANHLESGIPLGTPGAILSSGLILPLNICVGMVVACTMYSFYVLFRKGGF